MFWGGPWGGEGGEGIGFHISKILIRLEVVSSGKREKRSEERGGAGGPSVSFP